MIMDAVWIVVELDDDSDLFQINGAYSTREKAVLACGPREMAAFFEVDKNYTEIDTFLVVSKENPLGELVKS